MKHPNPPYVDLLAIIEAHCATSGVSKTSFGALAVGDPRLVDDLRKGREPRRKTVMRVMEFIATGRPHEPKAAQA